MTLPVSSNIDSLSGKYWTRATIIEEFLGQYTGRTRTEYKKHLQKFFLWSEKKQVHNVTPKFFYDYKMYLVNSDLKPNTINTYLSALRKFFKWCAEVGYVEVNPTVNLENVTVDKYDTKQARNLSDSERELLFNQTSKGSLRLYNERIFLLLLFNLGLRVHEVMNLKWRDLFLDNKPAFVTVHGKGKKVRELGLNDLLVRELKGFLYSWKGLVDYDNYVIQGMYHRTNKVNLRPTSREFGRQVLIKYGEMAGINMDNVSTHSGRVTTINILLDDEVPLRDVANFAGHESVNTTKRYDRKDRKRVIALADRVKIG